MNVVWSTASWQEIPRPGGSAVKAVGDGEVRAGQESLQLPQQALSWYAASSSPSSPGKTNLSPLFTRHSSSVVTSHPCSSHKSSQVKSTWVASQVKSLLIFSSQVKSHNCSSQVKPFFPSSHLNSVWCSVFPFCKVTKIFRQLRGHLNDRT